MAETTTSLLSEVVDNVDRSVHKTRLLVANTQRLGKHTYLGPTGTVTSLMAIWRVIRAWCDALRSRTSPGVLLGEARGIRGVG